MFQGRKGKWGSEARLVLRGQGEIKENRDREERKVLQGQEGQVALDLKESRETEDFLVSVAGRVPREIQVNQERGGRMVGQESQESLVLLGKRERKERRVTKAHLGSLDFQARREKEG